MSPLVILSTALRNLQRAPLRSALTALGVIVGVAAVVATTSIGRGAQRRMEEILAKPESRLVYLASSAPLALAARRAAPLTETDRLTIEDYDAIRQSVHHRTAASPRLLVQRTLAQAMGRTSEAVLEGVDTEGFSVIPRRVLAGTLFSARDVLYASNVCVISQSLASILFENSFRAGTQLRINGVAFTVLGIVDDAQPSPTQSRNSDLHIYAPFTSLLRRIDRKARISISVQATTMEHIYSVQRQIDDLMEERRAGRRADFVTTVSADSIQTYAQGSASIARLLAAVGTISLVVGGIGIMNIMLVSATERTREIGIRMALGTKTRDLMNQFLAEAGLLGLLGGTAGVVVGWLVCWLITKFNSWPTEISFDAVITSLACSLAVGLIFGYHPARYASLTSPTEALRAET